LAHWLALVTLAATSVLIVLGGVVTNTGAALAVPDWPSTFGYNMFLFPWTQMVGGIFYEHSHRLAGAAVGLLTLALAAALWRRGGRLRWLGIAAVAVVVLQGVLGGLRVTLLAATLAIVHGSLAPAFFALLAAIALLTSRAAGGSLRRPEPAVSRLAVAAVAAVYVQIVFGALLTHAGRLWLHVGGALVVFAVVPIVGARLRKSGDPVAAPVARALLILLGLQLLLGVGSFLVRFTTIWIPGEQATTLVLLVAHRLAGSLILGAAVVLALRAPIASGEDVQAMRIGRTEPAASWAGHPRSAAGSRSGEDVQAMRIGRTEPAASWAGHPRSAAGSRTPLQ
jgi:cytochrome c oxidase assembly protein subunit 15